ncbi:hypothetical protein [Ghiorsea bivora]|uniref:hypothetical protein n=1 Tax=Ghiorsea bivora TaxID=1485545 RepID=UPI001E37FCC7|nr:hypothetical protein [Ghiorsea bivora]
MNISFQITCKNITQFIEHWSSKYIYSNEQKYDDNVGKPLTAESRLELFEWKNGSVISAKKIESINKNYPLIFEGSQEERYLNHKKSGGAIWNIFYIHCLNPTQWPIYDQHTFRAMKYMKTGEITEIGNTNKQKYESYINEYIPFIESFNNINHRKLDMALFAFGQFLKIAKKYA